MRRQRVQPAPASPIWRKVLNYLFVFVTLILLVDALAGQKGLVETIRARRQSRDLATSLEQVRQENARLRELVRLLREDDPTIESIARQELGLIRPGEVLFIVKDVKPARQ